MFRLLNNTLLLLIPTILSVTLVGCSNLSTTSSDASSPGNYTNENLAEVNLGAKLFFDPRLSSNNKIACSTCHSPELGFGDGQALGTGVSGKQLKRHTPSLYNLAWSGSFFWDGRAESLEEQALMPIQNPDEMGLTLAKLESKLSAIPYYEKTFREIYPKSGVTAKNAARAIAAFERTIVALDAPYDKFIAGDHSAISTAAVRGLDVFNGKGKCVTCHSGIHFTDGQFHNNGLPGDDPGRAAFDKIGHFQMSPYPFFHTQKAFKTPSLRNIMQSAPYMHNGMLNNIKEVVEFYNDGGVDHESYGRSFDVKPLHLTEQEKNDLIEFLKTLESPVHIDIPELPDANNIASR